MTDVDVALDEPRRCAGGSAGRSAPARSAALGRSCLVPGERGRRGGRSRPWRRGSPRRRRRGRAAAASGSPGRRRDGRRRADRTPTGGTGRRAGAACRAGGCRCRTGRPSSRRGCRSWSRRPIPRCAPPRRCARSAPPAASAAARPASRRRRCALREDGDELVERRCRPARSAPVGVTRREPACHDVRPRSPRGFGPSEPIGPTNPTTMLTNEPPNRPSSSLRRPSTAPVVAELLVQLLLAAGVICKRLALLHDVLVEVEVLGPAHEAEADAEQRRGEPEAEQVARVLRAVADRRGDAAGDGDDERDDRRSGRPGRSARPPWTVTSARPSAARSLDRRVTALVGRADPAGQGDERQQREQPGGEALGDRADAAEVVDAVVLRPAGAGCRRRRRRCPDR